MRKREEKRSHLLVRCSGVRRVGVYAHVLSRPVERGRFYSSRLKRPVCPMPATRSQWTLRVTLLFKLCCFLDHSSDKKILAAKLLVASVDPVTIPVPTQHGVISPRTWLFIICLSKTFEFSGRLRNASEKRHKRRGAVSGIEADIRQKWGHQEPKDESKRRKNPRVSPSFKLPFSSVASCIFTHTPNGKKSIDVPRYHKILFRFFPTSTHALILNCACTFHIWRSCFSHSLSFLNFLWPSECFRLVPLFKVLFYFYFGRRTLQASTWLLGWFRVPWTTRISRQIHSSVIIPLINQNPCNSLKRFQSQKLASSDYSLFVTGSFS